MLSTPVVFFSCTRHVLYSMLSSYWTRWIYIKINDNSRCPNVNQSFGNDSRRTMLFRLRRQRKHFKIFFCFPATEIVVFYYFQYNISNFHITARTWPWPGMIDDSAEFIAEFVIILHHYQQFSLHVLRLIYSFFQCFFFVFIEVSFCPKYNTIEHSKIFKRINVRHILRSFRDTWNRFICTRLKPGNKSHVIIIFWVNVYSEIGHRCRQSAEMVV